eukprot:4152899-Heterocapsa_arctica.AAC.1
MAGGPPVRFQSKREISSRLPHSGGRFLQPTSKPAAAQTKPGRPDENPPLAPVPALPVLPAAPFLPGLPVTCPVLGAGLFGSRLRAVRDGRRNRRPS